MSRLSENLHITKTEKTILQVIAKEGERTYYELWKKDKVAASNKTVQIALKKLQRKGFIRPQKKTEGKREKKPYVLTFQGLFATLFQPESLKDADQIAKQQGKLVPLIFGKWQHFKSSGVDDASLRNALDWLCYMAWHNRYETANWVMRDFSMYVFNRTKPKERVRWLRAIHADPDLSKWALEEERRFHIYADTLKYTFRLIREPKPDWDEALEELYRIARMPMIEHKKGAQKYVA